MSESANTDFREPALSDVKLDALTGLPDRAWLETHLDDEITRHPGEVSVLFVDLDDLKKTNDGPGRHAAGDQLLIGASSTLIESVRTTDSYETDKVIRGRRSSTSRIGGDEFVLVLPGVSTTEELEIVKQRVQHNLSQKGINASLGGRPHQPGESLKDLIEAADKLMYADKRARKENQRAAKIDVLSGRKRFGFFVTSKVLNPLASAIEKRHGVK